LAAYWTLDEPSGNRADSAGTNVLIPAAPITPVAGKFGNAAHFIGDSNRLTCASNPVLTMGSGVDYTFAAWVQIADKSAMRSFVSKAGSGFDEYIIGFDTTAPGLFVFTVKGPTAYHSIFSTIAGTPTVNTWYLVIAWHDATDATINISINGGATFDSA